MVKSRVALLLVGMLLVGGCSQAHHTHIDVATAPPPVINGFNAEFPGLTISHVDRIDYPDHSSQYEVKFRDARNEYHRKLFSSDGRLLGDKANVAMTK